MSVQDIFYLLGSIYMTVGIIILIVICIILLMIANAIKSMQHLIEEKINTISHAVEDPSGLALKIGAKVTKHAVNRIKKAIEEKTSRVDA